MSNRLDKDREAKLQPHRMQIAMNRIAALGLCPTSDGKTTITFQFKGSTIQYFPYSGWATGKTIKDGRGLENLLKQLQPSRGGI